LFSGGAARFEIRDAGADAGAVRAGNRQGNRARPEEGKGRFDGGRIWRRPERRRPGRRQRRRPRGRRRGGGGGRLLPAVRTGAANRHQRSEKPRRNGEYQLFIICSLARGKMTFTHKYGCPGHFVQLPHESEKVETKKNRSLSFLFCSF